MTPDLDTLRARAMDALRRVNLDLEADRLRADDTAELISHTRAALDVLNSAHRVAMGVGFSVLGRIQRETFPAEDALRDLRAALEREAAA